MADAVALALAQGKFALAAGGTATTTATVRNQGTIVDQYRVTVEGLDAAWWDVVPAAVSLFPGDEATVTLNLHPPAGALAGDHPWQLRAASVDDPARAASCPGTLTVGVAGGLLLALNPSLVTGRSGRYAVQLTNKANSEVRLTLAGVDAEEGLEYSFEPPVLSVPAYGSSEAGLVVRPRSRPWSGAVRSFPFTVRALPEEAEEPAAEADGELQYKPLLGQVAIPTGRWRLLALLIPVFALAWLLRPQAETTATPTPTVVAAATKAASVQPTAAQPAAAKVPPPIIERLEVVEAKPGFALAWKVKDADADKVEINGKKVTPEGQNKVQLSADTVFELKASNAGGTTSKRLSALVFPPPVISFFTANPEVVGPGGSSTLRWKAERAEQVHVRVGDQEIKPTTNELVVQPDESKDYVLFAENGVGWVVSRVFVKVGTPQNEVYKYNFEKPSAEWELQGGAWQLEAFEGSQRLRSTAKGSAQLLAHSGDVFSLRFRFRATGEDSLVAVVRDGPPNAQRRYAVTWRADRVSIARVEGGTSKVLGERTTKIDPKAFHDAAILVGGGSLDVFVDGQPVVGVDEANLLPAGTIGFEATGPAAVYVDDVEVSFGAEPAPHARAPRP
jgi:hypothetical protein